MKTYQVAMTLLAFGLVTCGPALAITFGDDVTIYDKYGFGTTDNWYGKQEDQEVEYPVILAGQAYDLEGMAWDGSRLTVVGGYNSANAPRTDMDPGDLFIAVDGIGDPVVYGELTGNAATQTEKNQWGYDFVYDLDFNPDGTYSYSLYGIDANTYVHDIEYSYNRRANPWRYSRDGTLIATSGLLSMGTYTDAALTDYGYIGGTHYTFNVDLDLLPVTGGSWFTAHYTMECGNDALNGRAVTEIPDGGLTLVLLGTGLLGMTATRRLLIR